MDHPPPFETTANAPTPAKRSFNTHLIPTRLTLSDQTVECLRQGLLQNRWRGVMPSELELCRELNVSRVTLRRALAVLFADGCLCPGGRGGRHSIVAKPQARNSATRSVIPVTGALVRVLSPQPRFIISGDTQIIFQTMSETLGRSGLHLEFEHHPGCRACYARPSIIPKAKALPAAS